MRCWAVLRAHLAGCVLDRSAADAHEPRNRRQELTGVRRNFPHASDTHQAGHPPESQIPVRIWGEWDGACPGFGILFHPDSDRPFHLWTRNRSKRNSAANWGIDILDPSPRRSRFPASESIRTTARGVNQRTSARRWPRPLDHLHSNPRPGTRRTARRPSRRLEAGQGTGRLPRLYTARKDVEAPWISTRALPSGASNRFSSSGL
jgi:hypothetical protein